MKRRLKETLSESRWRHTEGVVRAAERMAEKFGVNVEKAHAAALLHDCAKCMPLEETKSNASIAGMSNLYIVTETPIVAFINNAFHLQEEGGNHDCTRFWKRVNRWIHADLSSQETSSGSSDDASSVNSRILNYSVYHRVYKYSYFLCTCMTWFVVVVVLLRFKLCHSVMTPKNLKDKVMIMAFCQLIQGSL